MLETVTLKLPGKLLSEARKIAKERSLSVGELIRQYLADEVNACKTPAQERVAMAVSQLKPIFGATKRWKELTLALERRGYVLRAHGTGLAIYDASDDRFVCDTETVGYRYRKLVKRFGGPMPGHSYGLDWIEDVGQVPDGLIERK